MRRITLGSSNITQKEMDSVMSVLHGDYISPGPVVEWVEKEMARLHGYKHCVALNSGQTALEIGLRALEQRFQIRKRNFQELDLWFATNGEEGVLREDGTIPLVAVPATTYISSLAAVIMAGMNFILVDVGLDGNMDPSCLRYAIKKGTENNRPIDIVMPVHLYGKACSDEIRQICEENNLLVIEDACESMLAKGIGWGDICTSSFYANHLLSAGSGGIIMTNDDELDLLCWKLINHGRESRFNNNDIHRITEKFRFASWGTSSKWSDVNAAIAKAQILRRDELYGKRAGNAAHLSSLLESFDDHLILPELTWHRFMMYPIVLKSHLDTQKVLRLLNDAGIEIRRMMPITNQPVVIDYYKDYYPEVNLVTEFPIAHILNEQGFYIGCHGGLDHTDMTYIATELKKAVLAAGGQK